MSRCECPAESVKQSQHSPSVVSDGESIVYALVEPITYRDGSVTLISKSKLKDNEQSVCRAHYCTGADAKSKITEALIERDPSRIDQGFLYAHASEIRAVLLGETGEGAFCVIDDGLDGFEAHAVLGFSNPSDVKFRSHREAARANLVELLKSRGTFTDWSGPPFCPAATN